MAKKEYTEEEIEKKYLIAIEKRKISEKRRYQKDPDRFKAAQKRYQLKNKEKLADKQKLDRLANPEKYKLKQQRYKENNPEKAKENRRIWKEKNREKIKEQNRRNSLKNKDKINARRKERRCSDPKIKERDYQWAKDNKDKRAFSGAKRRAKKLQATPDWLTKEDWRDIKRIYKVSAYLTKHTKIKHTVDHIIPLQGEYVSGMHVPWNLQILTDAQNTSKGIKVLPEHC